MQPDFAGLAGMSRPRKLRVMRGDGLVSLSLPSIEAKYLAEEMKKPWLTILGLTAFMTVVPTALIFLDNSNQELRKKIQTGSTQAKITAVDMANHATAYYEYVVGDKLYQSSSSGWGGMSNSGDSVILHYNPKNPAQSSLGDYRRPIPYCFVCVVAAITFIVTWSYYLIFIKPRYKLSKPTGFPN